MHALRLSNGKPVTLSTELGGGGEGKIYAVLGEPSLVAKVYHLDKQTAAQGKKLLAMYANPPDDSFSIAWPVDLLQSSRGDRIIGFLMRKVTQSLPLHTIYNPKTRRDRVPFFNYFYLHRTARNLAAATATLHNKGYIIGDVNESNILVSERALVTLVDTDSFQVRDRRSREVYRCPVGKPEFTPPELQGEAFSSIDRTPEHDTFGLAVLIFQLLMEGTHPFDGVYLGTGEPPPKETRIGAGHLPYSPHIFNYRPKPFAPPFSIVHPKIEHLFLRCFQSGHINPKLRPSAATWVRVLKEAEVGLRECSHNAQHRYGRHLSACPWCERTQKLGGRDPFPSKSAPRRPTLVPPAVVKTVPRRRVRFDPKLLSPKAVLSNPVSPKPVSSQSISPPRRRRPMRRLNPIDLLPLPLALGAAFVLMGNGDFRGLRDGYERTLDVASDTLNRFEGNGNGGQCSGQTLLQNLPFWPSNDDRLYHCQLDRAQELASSGNFGLAIATMTKLPPPLLQKTEARGLVDRWSRQILNEATEEYESGQLNVALALVGDIPEMSALFNEARDISQRWSREWMQNQNRLQIARKAIAQDRHEDAKKALDRVTTVYWQQRALETLDEVYLWEVQQAIDGKRFGEAKAAMAKIANPYRKQQIEETIAWAEEMHLAQKVDAEHLEAARKALAQGRFQEAKNAADRVESRTNEIRAREIDRQADKYIQLQNLLASGEWDNASRRTRTQLLLLSQAQVYCEDFLLIDRLWSQYSQGQYGLSAQLRFKEREGIIGLGWENITPEQQLELNQIYPSRPNFGSYGATLDSRLKSCGL
ncbi:MAG: GUN4 domain-containing protein [Cyanobacteriota bacterium]|nr:GUN4 domain-containing protein [Cyanobacteriota bacterium]